MGRKTRRGEVLGSFNEFFSLMAALFGYYCAPAPIQVSLISPFSFSLFDWCAFHNNCASLLTCKMDCEEMTLFPLCLLLSSSSLVFQLIVWCMYWPMAGTFLCYKLRAFRFREVPKMNEPAPGEGVATMSQFVRAVNADGSDIDDTLSDSSIEPPKDIEEGKEPSPYEGAFDGAGPVALAPKASIIA